MVGPERDPTNTTRSNRASDRVFDRKTYRDARVASQIRNGLAFQIKALRDAHGWSQRDLGERVGMAQETISLLENPNYGKFTLRTLLRLASTFDVAILVRFGPFSELVNWESHLTADDLAPPSYADDLGMDEFRQSRETDGSPAPASTLAPGAMGIDMKLTSAAEVISQSRPSNLLYFADYARGSEYTEPPHMEPTELVTAGGTGRG